MYTLPVPHTCIHTLLKNLYHNSCPFNDRLTLGYKMEQKPSFFLSDGRCPLNLRILVSLACLLSETISFAITGSV